MKERKKKRKRKKKKFVFEEKEKKKRREQPTLQIKVYDDRVIEESRKKFLLLK